MSLADTIRSVIRRHGADIVRSPAFFGILDDNGAFLEEHSAARDIFCRFARNGYIGRLYAIGTSSKPSDADMLLLFNEAVDRYCLDRKFAAGLFERTASGLGIKFPTSLATASAEVQNGREISRLEDALRERDREIADLTRKKKKRTSRQKRWKKFVAFLDENGDEIIGIFLVFFCALFVISLVVIVYGWIAGSPHAAIWTWIFWGSPVGAVASLVIGAALD